VRALLPAGGHPLTDEEVERLYMPPAGPHLRANFVLSLDGAAEFGGRSRPLATAEDTRLFHLLRALADVVLVGASTVRREGYGPVVIGEAAGHRRRQRGQTRPPPVAVVTSSGDLDPGARLFSGGGRAGAVRTIVFVGDGVSEDRRRQLEAVADVVAGNSGVLDVAEVVAELAARGLTRVLCEGGPLLFSQLLGAGLVDEVCLTQTAVLAGPGRVGLLTGAAFDRPLVMEPEVLIQGDGALFGRYAIKAKE
jgi:riboflavin biosynthesis pyrimidine reductase